MKKLSIRGKIAFVPSLCLTIPFLLLIIVFGFLLWTASAVLRIFGILEAIQVQYEFFQNVVRNNRLKRNIAENKRKNRKNVFKKR